MADKNYQYHPEIKGLFRNVLETAESLGMGADDIAVLGAQLVAVGMDKKGRDVDIELGGSIQIKGINPENQINSIFRH